MRRTLGLIGVASVALAGGYAVHFAESQGNTVADASHMQSNDTSVQAAAITMSSQSHSLENSFYSLIHQLEQQTQQLDQQTQQLDQQTQQQVQRLQESVTSITQQLENQTGLLVTSSGSTSEPDWQQQVSIQIQIPQLDPSNLLRTHHSIGRSQPGAQSAYGSTGSGSTGSGSTGSWSTGSWSPGSSSTGSSSTGSSSTSTTPSSSNSSPAGNGAPAIQSVTLPPSTQSSENWAGYIDVPKTNHSYTSITGSWVVPLISGQASSVAAQWIGLGGVSTRDLLQVGTIEDFSSGQEQTQVFWEKLPNTAQNILSVPVGSTIHAQIWQTTSTGWSLSIAAKTPLGQTLSKTIPVTLSTDYSNQIGSSAEWISEDPSNPNNTLYPLANTGTVKYSDATVNGSPLAGSGNQVNPIAMLSPSGNLLVAPSSIGSNGGAFSTTTVSTQSNSWQQQWAHPPFQTYSRYQTVSYGRRGHGWWGR